MWYSNKEQIPMLTLSEKYINFSKNFIEDIFYVRYYSELETQFSYISQVPCFEELSSLGGNR